MHVPFSHHDDHKERRHVINRLEREGLDFEKWLITLATGTLVLSVTLLQNSAFNARGQDLLITAWVALVISIFAGLFDRLLYIFSLSAHPLLSEDDQHDLRERRWLSYWAWSERMSWIQILTFFAGIVALLLFAINQL